VQGSATGAYSPLRATSKPSFVLMDVDGVRVRPSRRCARVACPADAAMRPQLVAYVYQLVDGEVKVDKIEYVKAEKAAA
jgi:vacuolar protein sorting-associated protein 29